MLTSVTPIFNVIFLFVYIVAPTTLHADRRRDTRRQQAN